METLVQAYLDNIFTLHKKFLREEFHYLREKNKHLHIGLGSEITEIITNQQDILSDTIRHLTFFQKHKKKLEDELSSTHKNSNLSLPPLDILLKKEDYFSSFLISNQNRINLILDNQKKSINKPKSRYLSKIFTVYEKKSKSRLVDYISKEEEFFSWVLDQYLVNPEELEKHKKYFNSHSRYHNLEDSIFKTSVLITAVPLGPLELASIPFWCIYLSMHEFEKISKDFKHYRDVTKPRIIKEVN